MAAADDAQTAPCMPCRGTGQVISGLGGKPRPVSCPWCEGEGVSRRDQDAQARWRTSPAPGEGGGREPRQSSA